MNLLEDKIVNFQKAYRFVQLWKKNEEKVVFTNGVFDLLHPGHVRYLTEAKSLGQHLVVGLNTDASVKRLKGADRPIQNEQDRAIVLAGLWAVDLVIPFEEDTPIQLIKELLPHILVKGGDYTFDTIIGAREVAENNGEVKTIQFIKGKSTTSLIKKILK
jgi:rfaE bifunctional protein nucleotidyltransferase chain/domain